MQPFLSKDVRAKCTALRFCLIIFTVGQLTHNESFVKSLQNAAPLSHCLHAMSLPLLDSFMLQHTHTLTEGGSGMLHNTPFLPQAAEAITALCALCLEEAAINRNCFLYTHTHACTHNILLIYLRRLPLGSR